MIPFRRILFPVDFSEATLDLVPYVTEMAQRFDATVTVLNAFDLVRDYYLAPSGAGSGRLSTYRDSLYSRFAGAPQTAGTASRGVFARPILERKLDSKD